MGVGKKHQKQAAAACRQRTVYDDFWKLPRNFSSAAAFPTEQRIDNLMRHFRKLTVIEKTAGF